MNGGEGGIRTMNIDSYYIYTIIYRQGESKGEII